MPLWRDIAPVASIVIALAAAVFSGLQWLEARDQAFLTTKPHVDIDVEDDSDEPMVGIAISNAGPGPALIKSVSFYVDRKPVADADEMGRTYAKVSSAELDYQILEPGNTLADRREGMADQLPQTPRQEGCSSEQIGLRRLSRKERGDRSRILLSRPGG